MSVETAKVISASNPNPWEHGITFYDMVFERNGQPFNCAWGTKGGEPQPGEEITGEFSQKADGTWKFTKGSKDKPQGGSSGGGSKPWQPESERDPERSARILRQHSEEMAVRVLGLSSLGVGVLDDWDEAKAAIKEWTDWFDEDVRQAAAQAHGNATESASPPSSASRGSEQQPASEVTDEDEQRLDDALYNAGINDFNERRWLTKAWKGLPSDRQMKCLGGLIAGDIETPPKTLKGLQEIAGPMPESFRQPDDSVPF